MAATGYTPIQLYRTSTASAAPVAGNLTSGELAINYNAADMAIYAKNGSGSVIRIMNNPAGLKYPTTDGTDGQLIKTNGAGVLSWYTPTTGTVTGLSVATAYGLAGTVTTGATPVITIATTISGMLKGVAGAFTAASSGVDFAPATSGNSILYGNGSGGFSAVTVGTGLNFATGSLTNTGILTVSGTASRVSVTAGQNPVVDLIASGVGAGATVGSTALIPVITYDTYGRITAITTAAAKQGTVTSVAALTLGTTGTDLTSTVANGTTDAVITLNVPTASASNRGALSSTDWTTFNNKVTSVSGTAPVSVTSGTTPTVSMAVATSSADGYLTSADWTTFNNKQAALVSGSNIKTVNSTSLLGSGDVAVQAVLVSGTNIKTINSNSLLGSGDIAVQATLVSGTNIKTVNGVSIVGAGDAAVGVTSITASTTTNYGLSLSGGTINAASPTGTIAITGTLAVPIANITATGTPSSTTFLAGNGTWAVPPGAGTITGVTTTGSAINGLSLTGGGTSGSVNVALTGTLSGVSLTTAVSGTLPIANGGTNATATPTSGAVAYGTGTAYAFTAAGTSGQVLTSAGSGAPTWTTPTTGTVTSITASTTAVNGLSLSGGTITGTGTIAITGSISGVSLTTAVSGILPVANGGTGASTLAGANIAVTNASNSFSAKQTFSGSTTALAAVITNSAEPITIVNSAVSSPVTFYFSTQSILYYTVDATANWTVNFAHSSTPTTGALNAVMSIGQAVTAVVMVKQGATPYYNNAVQVDGVPVTPKWQGVAPVAGNANGTDVYTYVIIKTADATFSVFASQTQFV